MVETRTLAHRTGYPEEVGAAFRVVQHPSGVGQGWGLPSLSPVSTALTLYHGSSLWCPKRLPVANNATCSLIHIWLFMVLTKEQERFSPRCPHQAFPPLSLSHMSLPPVPKTDPLGVGAEIPMNSLWGISHNGHCWPHNNLVK